MFSETLCNSLQVMHKYKILTVMVYKRIWLLITTVKPSTWIKSVSTVSRLNRHLSEPERQQLFVPYQRHQSSYWRQIRLGGSMMVCERTVGGNSWVSCRQVPLASHRLDYSLTVWPIEHRTSARVARYQWGVSWLHWRLDCQVESSGPTTAKHLNTEQNTAQNLCPESITHVSPIVTSR